MDYIKNRDELLKYVEYDHGVPSLISSAFDELGQGDFKELCNLILELSCRSKNVSASDVVLAKNFNRKFDKSNVCLRVTNNVIEDYKNFAGSLDVPVQDLMTYVLEYGLRHYREIKEI